MSKRVVYPGTFDPITLGHLDIIRRAKKVVDTLIVAVGHNPSKKTTFDLETRMNMIRESIGTCKNIEVISFSGLLVDAAKDNGADIIIRGLRAISDYESESQMAIVNRALNPDVDTMILVSGHEYSFISSSLIKEIAIFGGDISDFVPEPVLKQIELAESKKKKG